jgi:chromosome segregation ATPase
MDAGGEHPHWAPGWRRCSEFFSIRNVQALQLEEYKGTMSNLNARLQTYIELINERDMSIAELHKANLALKTDRWALRCTTLQKGRDRIAGLTVWAHAARAWHSVAKLQQLDAAYQSQLSDLETRLEDTHRQRTEATHGALKRQVGLKLCWNTEGLNRISALLCVQQRLAG